MRHAIPSHSAKQIDTRKPLKKATATAALNGFRIPLARPNLAASAAVGGSVVHSPQRDLPFDADALRANCRAKLMDVVRRTVAQVAMQLIEDEVSELVGAKYERKADANALRRHGKISSRIVMDGQPFEIQRPRVRDTVRRKEVELPVLKAFQSRDALSQEVQSKLIRGVATRKYDATLSELADGLGLKRSAVSAAFKVAAQKDLDALSSRRLDGETFVALMLDGVGFADVLVLVAIGVTLDGEKKILGLREGASENATAVRDLLADLIERGLNLTAKTLFVLDGAKALSKGVRDVFGERAVIQRCIVHKIRNVESYLPAHWHADVSRRLRAAWGMTSYDEARRALLNVHRWLSEHSTAAASLMEGLEETLTLHRLKVPPVLRVSLRTTNSIESVFSQVQAICHRVKRWRNGKMVLRRVGTALTHIEPKLRKIMGYRSLPLLVAALQVDTNSSESQLPLSNSHDSCAPCQTAVA